MADRLVRESERRAITGRCRSSWAVDEAAGRVPRRRQIGPRAVGWSLAELEAWVADPSGWLTRDQQRDVQA